VISARNIAALLLCAACAAAQPADRCGTGRDLVVRALERLTARNSNAEVEDALQLVKQAAEECAGLGDAWYFRSIFERKLGHAQLANYALNKAKLLGSEAMELGADPFTLAAPPGQPASKAIHEKYAVVIGIGKFQSNFVPSLRFTTKDARDFAAVLTDPTIGKFPAEHVHVVTDGDATLVRIKTELNWLARTAGPDDLAVIYLASHGSAREMDTAGANYVVTYDTEVDDQDHLYATALPMVEIASVVRTRLKARRATVFLDTCHSGGALDKLHAAAPSPAMMEKMDRGVGRVVIASSAVAQSSWESDKLGNGYFTYYLLQAMKQTNGQIPISKLFDAVRTSVAQSVKQDVHADQTPVMETSEQGAGDIVLGASLTGFSPLHALAAARHIPARRGGTAPRGRATGAAAFPRVAAQN
jgi:hypothetical protein